MSRWRRRVGPALLGAAVLAVLLFVVAPLLIVIVVSFNASAFIRFPPQQLSLRWYANIPRLEGFFDSLLLSLGLGLLATAITAVLGVLASLALTRYTFRGRQAVTAFFLSPLVLPALVIGIAMLQFFRTLDVFTTFTTLLLAHVAITLPYMVRTVTASLSVLDENLLDAARVLGADAMQTLVFVTLPTIRSGLMAGCLFTFIMSFDNYSVSLFLSDAKTETLPIRMLNYVEKTIDPTVAAVSAVLIVFSGVVLLVGERLVGLRRIGGLASGH